MVHTSMLMTRPGPTDTTGIQSDHTILHNMCSYTLVDCRGLNLHCPHTSIGIQLSTIQMQNDSWCIVMHLSAWHPQWSMWVQQATCMFHATVCLHWTIDKHRPQPCKDSLAVPHWMNAPHQVFKISNRTFIVANLETFSDIKNWSLIFWRNLRQEISQLLILSLF